MAVAFYLSPFLVHSLGTTKYGLWVLFGQAVSYMGLMELGIRTAVTAFIAKHHVKQDQTSLNSTIATALQLCLLLATLVVLLTLIIGLFVTRIFHIAPDLASEARQVFIIIGLTLASQLLGNVYAGTISGLQRYELSNAISILITLFRTIIIVVYISYNSSLMALAVITFSFEQLKHILFIIATYKLIPGLRVKNQLITFRKTSLNQMFSFSNYSFAINVSTKIVFYTDAIVIGIFKFPSEVTIYAIAWSLVEYCRRIIAKLSYVLAPAASEFQALNDKDKLANLLVSSTRAALFIVIPPIVFLLFLGKSFLCLWMGTEFISSYPILVLLLFAEIANSMFFPASNIILGMHKHKYLAFIRVVEAILNLILSVILIQIFGIIGVAVGTLFPSLILNFFFVLPYTVRVIRISAKVFFLTTLRDPLIAFCLSSLLGFILSYIFDPQSWPLFISLGLVFFLIYGVIVYFFALSSIEKGYLGSILRSLIQFVKRRDVFVITKG